MSGLIGVSPNMRSGLVGVHPEGTVIGSAYYFRSSNTTPDIAGCNVANGSFDWNATDTTRLEITVKNANSKMYIWHGTAQAQKATAGTGNFYQKRTIVGGASTDINGGSSCGRQEFVTAAKNQPVTLFAIDPHGQSVGTVIQYYIRGYSNDANYVIWCGDSGRDTINGIVMEVM
tara:strand:+ start:357 stop:878 length:522 start_codon:yes stop_codon:yes gene_type:complete